MNEVQKPSDTAWPMISRCMLAQWQGLDESQRAYITDQWNRGSHPTDFSLGHGNYVIWGVVRDPGRERPASTADELMSIKIDHWPSEFKPAFKMV